MRIGTGFSGLGVSVFIGYPRAREKYSNLEVADGNIYVWVDETDKS